MEKKDNKKKILLILVIFFTLVIFFIWLWLLKWQFSSSTNGNSADQKNLLNEPEITSSLEKIKSQFSNFSKSVKELLNPKKSTSTPMLTNEQINIIKEKVQAELGSNSNINNNSTNDN